MLLNKYNHYNITVLYCYMYVSGNSYLFLEFFINSEYNHTRWVGKEQRLFTPTVKNMDRPLLTSLTESSPTTAGALHILMIGKGGVGKSSLANAILGSQVCPVAEHPSNKIQHYHKHIDVFDMHVYDTRGLLDGEEELEDIVRAIKGREQTFDIIIACIKFNDRFDLSNRMVFDIISQLGRSSVWSKVCVALTHSDIIPADWPRNEQDNRFKHVLNDWREAISRYVKEKHGGTFDTIYATSHTQITTPLLSLRDWCHRLIIHGIAVPFINNSLMAGPQLALASLVTRQRLNEAISQVGQARKLGGASILGILNEIMSHQSTRDELVHFLLRSRARSDPGPLLLPIIGIAISIGFIAVPILAMIALFIMVFDSLAGGAGTAVGGLLLIALIVGAVCWYRKYGLNIFNFQSS